jgi:hypothetical protein
MNNPIGPVFFAAFVLAAPALAQPMPPGAYVWVSGDASPRDIHGNRAVANAPLPGRTGGAEPNAEAPSWAPFGPSGADTYALAPHPSIANRVIAGAGSSLGGGGIYVTVNGGSFWTQATGTGNRTINEVTFSSDGRGWAATDDGLFTSTDNGENWVQVPLPVSGQALVQDVTVDPTNPAVVWVGLGQFLGGTSTQLIFRSTNTGASWDDVTPPVTIGLGATVVAVDPANPQRVYAAFTGNFGSGNELWVTTNGGASWEERSFGFPNHIINDVAFGNGRVWVAGGQDFGSQFIGLYSSPDDGLSWTEHSAAWPSRAATSIAFDPSDGQRIFVGTTRAGVMFSDDGGVTWESSRGGTGTYQVNDIEFVPASSTIYLGMGSVAVLKSTNGGAAFSAAAGGISRLEITSFAVNPLNTSEIAAAYKGLNDGGIFISTDAGATWTLSSAPLPRWLRVCFAPDGTLYASHDGPLGRGDDGLWRRDPNGTWTNLGPGSPSSLDNIGLDIAVQDAPNPVILWSGYRWLPQPQVAQIWSYNRAAPNAWELEYASTQFGEQIASVAFLSGGQGPLAVAAQYSFGQDGVGALLRSTDTGDTWNPPAAWPQPNWHVWDIAAGGNGVLYALGSPDTGNNPSGVFMSVDHGESWQQQGTYPGGRTLVADPFFHGTLYTFNTFTNAFPHRSTDGGVTFHPFNTNFQGDVAAQEMVYGGTVNGRRKLYLATSSGGYATDLPGQPPCSGDFDGDGDAGTDADIEAFFACLSGSCCELCGTADFDGDGDAGTDADIEAFFRVLGGHEC